MSSKKIEAVKRECNCMCNREIAEAKNLAKFRGFCSNLLILSIYVIGKGYFKRNILYRNMGYKTNLMEVSNGTQF